MKILSIGNSFSQDAHRWLYDICASAGEEHYFANLFYSGCSLEQHMEFYQQDAAVYAYEINGAALRKIGLREALAAEEWEIITLQQASGYSGLPEHWLPYLEDLLAVVKAACPKAKIYLHQTWAYEKNAKHRHYGFYHDDQQEMFQRLVETNRRMAERIGAPLIPVGEAIQKLREELPEFDPQRGGMSINRDGYHLSHLYGRYAAALIWFKTLFGGDIQRVTFIPAYEGEAADPALLEKIKQVL